jgi:DNA polymerase-3 subunit chi
MQIDFYVLQKATRTWLSVLAQLCEKALQQQQHVLIQTHDDLQATAIDEYLWTFNDVSFLPHSRTSEHTCPIIISHDHNAIPQNLGILINCANIIPDWFGQAERIIEIVHSENKLICREHYKFYKDNEFQVQSHNI